MSHTFEDLIADCAKAKQPFQALVRKHDGTYQASVHSKYSNGKHNAFSCGMGATPAAALYAALHPTAHLKKSNPTEVDPLS